MFKGERLNKLKIHVKDTHQCGEIIIQKTNKSFNISGT